jgi:hypothetical protein
MCSKEATPRALFLTLFFAVLAITGLLLLSVVSSPERGDAYRTRQLAPLSVGALACTLPSGSPGAVSGVVDRSIRAV